MKVIVTGPRGKMGKLITQVAASRDDMKLVAGIAPKGRDYIGMDLGTVAMTGSELGVPVTDDLAGVIDSCDVIIDFSTKEMAMEVLDLAIAHKKALVCGSTGFSAEEMKRFEDAGKQIPMLYAANTSKLVNIMNKLLELVTTTLKDEIDIEILEMHDQWKKDAPSGTSKEMGEIMAHALGKELLPSTDARENLHVNLEQSAIILSVQVIFQAAIRYSSEAWENVLRSHIIPITGNALREVPVTVQLILTGKLLDSILLRTYSDFNTFVYTKRLHHPVKPLYRLSNKSFNFFFRHHTHVSLYNFSFFKHKECRDRHYTVLSCKFRFLIYIKLAHFDICALFCNLFHQRSHCLAWSAPRCPEVYQYRHF